MKLSALTRDKTKLGLIIALASCVYFAAQAWWRNYDLTSHPFSVYQNTVDIGTSCEFAYGSWPQNTTVEALKDHIHVFERRQMPLRKTFWLPKVPPGGFTLTKCHVDLSEKTPNEFKSVDLGPIFGETAVFVNSTLVTKQVDDSQIYFSIPPHERLINSTITIASRSIAPSTRSGPASLMPLALINDKDTFQAIRARESFDYVEGPIFRYGFSLALLMLLIATSFFGRNFQDLTWLSIGAVFLTLREWIQFSPAGFVSDLSWTVFHACKYLIPATLVLFVYSFTRITEYRKAVMGVSVLCLATYLSLKLTFSQWIDHRGAHQFVQFQLCLLLPALQFFMIGIIQVRNLIHNTTYRSVQLVIASGLTFLAAGIYFYQGLINLIDPGQNYVYIDYTFFTLFAVLLLYDMGKFQHQYFSERAAKEKVINDGKVNSAIAQSVLMLAHDVRKPFVIVNMLMEQLGNLRQTPQQMDVTKKFLPDLELSLAHIENMIADVMTFGRKQSPLPDESCAAEAVIATALTQVFRAYKGPTVRFSYDLKHRSALMVDATSVVRLFANIISNAAEAMQAGGMITITSTERPTRQIEFAIHNTGSFIRPELQSKIFDMFVTEGKTGGTGLGLSICKKVVSDHKGEIWVESQPTLGTTVHFTLPCDPNAQNKTTSVLAQSSADFTRNDTDNKPSAARRQNQARRRLLRTLEQRRTPLNMLLVDDESFYQSIVRSHIEALGISTRHLNFKSAQTATEALAACRDTDLILCDINLADKNTDGLNLTKQMRRLNAQALIVLHSNISANTIEDVVKQVGAQSYLPKPLSQEDLTHLLLAALKSSKNKRSKNLRQKSRLIVVDDDPFVLDAWQRNVPELEVRTYISPKTLMHDIKKDTQCLKGVRAIVLDYYYDNERTDIGALTRLLRHKTKAPLILSTAAPDGDELRRLDVDLIIGKDPIGWDDLANLLRESA